MKIKPIFLIFLMSLYFAIFGLAQSPYDDDAWYNIISKSEEFNYFDGIKWKKLDANHQTWGQEKYDTSLVNIVSGNLELSINRVIEKLDTTYYTGGIKSNKINQMRFGYIEMEARIPVGKGLWPVFWLFNANCGPEYYWYDEIDIVEPYFHSNDDHFIGVNWWDEEAHGNITCKPKYGGGYKLQLDPVLDNIDSVFHKYAVEWFPNHMVFYYDDDPFFCLFNDTLIANHGIPGFEMPSDLNGLTVYCNYQINPKKSSPPDDQTDISQKIVVNYIRQYDIDKSEINQNLVQSNFNFTNYNYKIKNSLTLSNSTVPTNDNVTLRANEYIQLNGEFTVPLGSTFTAYTIEDY